MRLLVVLLTILLFLNILGFVLTNLETRVSVQVWRTENPGVPLYVVVILSVLAGIVYASIIGLAEGTNLRLANRRLRRDVQKLETELNFLRTQPLGPPRPEPDELGTSIPADRAGTRESKGEASFPPASAPVYGTGDDDWG